MFLSLRTTIAAAFALFLLSLLIVGFLAVGNAARSAEQAQTLESGSLVPAIKLNMLGQELDQERELLRTYLPFAHGTEKQAIDAEVAALDRTIQHIALTSLPASSRPAWQKAWSAYLAERTTFARLPTRKKFGSLESKRLADRLDAVWDVATAASGLQLYRGAQTYTTEVSGDWQAIRITLAILIFFTIIGFIVTTLIILRLRGGLANLLNAAQAISSGQVNVRIHQPGRDEIAKVAAAINHMVDALISAERRATSDSLTGLYNHRTFHLRLAEEWSRSQRSGTPLTVLMIDMNNFKLFNDTYGHRVGDQVLTIVADLLRTESRGSDLVARYGGDEFAILSLETTGLEARVLGERIVRAAQAARVNVGPDVDPLPISLSIGLASWPGEVDSAEGLVELADTRMYEVKRAGGGVWGRQHMPWIPRLAKGASFGMLEGLIASIDARDHYTHLHSEWVARFADTLAEALNLEQQQRERLTIAALVHDVGKIGTPHHILNKPGRLTEDEYTIVKQHVVLSELLVSQIAPASDILDGVRYHHERWDGQGYPYGMAGEMIPLFARILALADASSAMTIDRPYRKRLTAQELVGELLRNRGTQFDPQLTDAFVEALLASSTSPISFETGTVGAADEAG